MSPISRIVYLGDLIRLCRDRCQIFSYGTLSRNPVNHRYVTQFIPIRRIGLYTEIGGNTVQNSPFKTSPLVVIAAVSAIIFSLVGIAAITGQIPVVNSTSGEPVALGGESGIKPNIMPIVEKRAFARRMEQAKPCANCGVVDSITMNEVKGDGGTVDGSYADHGTEKNVNKTVTHQVKIRMDNGTYRVVLQQGQPVFQVGEKVKIIDDIVVQLEQAKMVDKKGMFTLILVTLTNRLF